MNYSRENPSPRYQFLLTQYRNLHTEGEKNLGLPPEMTFPGQSLLPQAQRIKNLVERVQAKTVLDYGSGKGLQYRPMPVRVQGEDGEWPSIQAYWGVDQITCYDPCYEPHSRVPSGKFDGVISTDVLEHCPEDDLHWIIDEIFSYAERFVFANVACYPAKKHLPNGENAHCTIKPVEWWFELIKNVVANHPNLLCEFWIQYRVETPEGPRLEEKRISNF